MPRVPEFRPFSTEQPIGAGDAKARVDTNLAAFGGGVGEAFSGLGGALTKAGDELFARAQAMQQLNNEAAANDADAQYMMKTGELHAQYNSTTGKAAVDAYPQYIKDIQQLREDIGSTLGSPDAKRLYDNRTKGTMGRTIFNGAGHAATEQKRYVAGASQAVVDATVNQTLQNPKDEVSFQRGLKEAEFQVRDKQSFLGGWSPEKTEEEVSKTKSSMITARIQGMSRTDPFEAKRLLEQNKGILRADDFDKSEKVVQTQLFTTGARNISADINKDLFESDSKLPDRGLDERVKEGTRLAEKMFPDDKLFPTYVANRIRADYDARKRDIKDSDDHARLNINSGINGEMGKVPTSVEELRALSPDIARGWDMLPAGKKGPFLNALAKNARGDVPETEERFRTYMGLRGKATSINADDRAEFLSMNVVDADIPRKWRTQLLKMQESLKANSEADPRVNRAMRILTDAGIAPRRDQDKEGNFVFRGGLQEALDVFSKASPGKQPTLEEVKQIGTQLVQEQRDPNKFDIFGLLDRKSKLYEMTVPNDIIEKIKEDPRFKGTGIVPTDEQIRQEYVRLQYRKLYDKPKPSGTKPEEGGPPTSR